MHEPMDTSHQVLEQAATGELQDDSPDAKQTNGSHNTNSIAVRSEDNEALHVSEDQLMSTVKAHWNARQWHEAARSLEVLVRSSTSPTSQIDQRSVQLLLGICFSFAGYWQWSKAIFEALIEGEVLSNDRPVLDPLEISAAHWLGDTCLLLRKFGDASLAWSIAYDSMCQRMGSLESDKQRVLTGLNILENGQLQKGVRGLTSILESMRDPKRGTFSILPNLSILRKSNYIASVIPACKEKRPSTNIPQWEERPDNIFLSQQCFFNPFDLDKPWPLRYDTFLMLDPRKFLHVKEFGLPVNKHQMNIRFLPNLNNRVRMMVVHTTKRPLEWFIPTIESTLATRGMLCVHYFDRMKVIRVREFGLMDYVIAFTIVFIKSPLINSLSIQIPTLDVRTDWKTIHEPEVKAHSRLVQDIKSMLQDAEERDEPFTRRQIANATPKSVTNERSLFRSERTGSINSRRSLLGNRSEVQSIASESTERQSSITAAAQVS